MGTINFSTNRDLISNERCFKHFTKNDCIIMESLINRSLNTGYDGPKITISFLAKKLGYSKSTISRELKRGGFTELDGKGKYVTRYRCDYSISKRNESSKRSHYKTKLQKGSMQLKYIEDMIKKGADVNTAIVLYEFNFNEKFPVCEKTLYNYYHKKMIKGIRPYKKFKTREKVTKSASFGKNISERPFEPSDRTEFGHWEGDLIVGSRGGSKECLLTLIERQTRFYYAVKIGNKTNQEVINGLNSIEELIGLENFKKIFKTITFDNGREFSNSNKMELSKSGDENRTLVYYANAYHSWERGSNERGNRMMRKYFPKKTDFSLINDQSIKKALCKINYTSRKILGNKSSMSLIKEREDEISLIFQMFNLKNLFLVIR